MIKANIAHKMSLLHSLDVLYERYEKVLEKYSDDTELIDELHKFAGRAFTELMRAYHDTKPLIDPVDLFYKLKRLKVGGGKC